MFGNDLGTAILCALVHRPFNCYVKNLGTFTTCVTLLNVCLVQQKEGGATDRKNTWE